MATVVKPKRVQMKIKKKALPPSLTEQEIALVRDTFRPIADAKEQAAKMFYSRLFELDPSIRSLFATTNMAEQGQKLMSTVAVAIGSLEKLDQVVPTLRDLGIAHDRLGGLTDADGELALVFADGSSNPKHVSEVAVTALIE